MLFLSRPACAVALAPSTLKLGGRGRSNNDIIFEKPLTKIFKRGCYGATQWAPVVLPVVALLPQDEQPSVLTSVWEGRTHLVGVADSLKVVEAVAETATFLLLHGY